LRTTDDISGFVQKWRFALRKPPFYPLNYGDIFQGSEVRDQISDLDPVARGEWSKSRARRLNALVPLVDCGW